MKKRQILALVLAGSTIVGCSNKQQEKENCISLPRNATMIGDNLNNDDGVVTHDLTYDLHDGTLMVLKHINIGKDYGCLVPAKEPKYKF